MQLPDPAWCITQNSWEPAHQRHSETIFTIGNGYLSTRGVFEEGYPRESRATFLHGVFDDVPIVFTELANIPDWLELTILLDGEHYCLNMGEVLFFERSLDLRNGLLTRRVRWRSPQGNITLLEFERFASLADSHSTLLRVKITPENYSGTVEIHAGINGEADNEGYKHWEWLGQAAHNGSLWLHTRTRASQIELAAAARLSLKSQSDIQMESWNVHNHPTLVRRTALRAGESIEIEKVVVYYTSRDTSHPLDAARQHLAELPNPAWDSLWRPHQENWEKEWQTCDVEIEGDPEAQIAVRFSLFQLLIAAPRQDEHVSIGAKTLSGYGYRGHVFWDTEIFMLPFFTYTQPAIARNLLSYRYHNLDGARRKARANGFEGAQYPWESAATGDEVTPTWVPHFADRTKMVRIWTGDIEIHISAMICYALCQYWKATGDDHFILHRGAEIFFEVARFWASRAEWNKEHSRYEFHDVIGPDEYHDHVDNNAFTNAFARWTLQNAIRLYSWLTRNHPDIAATYCEKLHLMPAELQQWQDVAEKIYFPYDPQTGLIEQFDGYFQRRDVDLQALEPRSESIQSIFGIEGANLTQVLKQPDVLMLAYLLPELLDERSLQANYDYYTPRTDHTYGSSLGPSIQAIMACRLGKQEDAYEHFMRAARADLRDVRGNAGDGIHGASAGGVWQAVVFGFGGLHMDQHGWHIVPRLPSHWKRLKFHFTWRGHPYLIDLPNHGPFSSEAQDDSRVSL
ncbi:trehalose and maltose hydrolase [Anaerolinea thermolimosa]|uniref:glycoside hydrolase family 65 protein n=1 Tax=Anaerolinea thermolimosa TaxID=229919 RepID=UPI000783EA38|nr:glycoside hydrolase family 65 protein [Anaerolinea thermolimosa]GAP07565.1 trehalose and maltose hydrolase [Anaerolinea thermolimosa]